MLKLIGLMTAVVLLSATASAQSVSCKQDRYGGAFRCDNGVTYKKDRYSYDTVRGSDGSVSRRDRYGGRIRIEGRDRRSNRERH